ncbi:MAG: methyltransferase domain-containing protein, partial [Verrucomicrobiota bacterium]|nr:methyltransferase domain-containing protein [Verrucomicrobiota bacterium]
MKKSSQKSFGHRMRGTKTVKEMDGSESWFALRSFSMTHPAAEDLNRRRAHYDEQAAARAFSRKLGAGYQQQLHRYYRLFIPPNQRVLEVGCGHGDLLNALAPEYGVGIDFSSATLGHARKNYPQLHFIEGDAHALPIEEPFDAIILSDLVNDLWDVQQVLAGLAKCCHPGTRLVLNFHNNLWGLPLSLSRKLGLAHPVPQQNWLTPEDIEGLLKLGGFETVQRRAAILLPLGIPLLASLCNRVLAHLPLFRAFDLVHFFVARPVPQPRTDPPSVSVVVAARNEAGNIEPLLQRIPTMGSSTEILFVEGGSTDGTYKAIEELLQNYLAKHARLLRQTGKGKGDAVRLGFGAAKGDIL